MKRLSDATVSRLVALFLIYAFSSAAVAQNVGSVVESQGISLDTAQTLLKFGNPQLVAFQFCACLVDAPWQRAILGMEDHVESLDQSLYLCALLFCISATGSNARDMILRLRSKLHT